MTWPWIGELAPPSEDHSYHLSEIDDLLEIAHQTDPFAKIITGKRTGTIICAHDWYTLFAVKMRANGNLRVLKQP
ncbi:hypothetical protein [Methylobacterium currus]|nr:hypothetical protein [Methylobacterium currus]